MLDLVTEIFVCNSFDPQPKNIHVSITYLLLQYQFVAINTLKIRNLNNGLFLLKNEGRFKKKKKKKSFIESFLSRKVNAQVAITHSITLPNFYNYYFLFLTYQIQITCPLRLLKKERYEGRAFENFNHHYQYQIILASNLGNIIL